ncbi:McrC family protein [Streptomyces sp. NBC_00151]|uniref:McrC family protein n=1 Tax=Streptomyces sp. NBC_00151 TaxID=2975669 RepID=UPI002DDA0AA9|nr:restriction endonuclease [Streptomyces sp. NBC_00151]WRZ42623.1 McrC family protein [Streptomyces sp. NBC_00151]
MTDAPPVRLKEAGGWSEWQLTPEQIVALDESEHVRVRPSRRAGWCRLEARDRVGAARVGRGPAQVRLSVEPKVSVDRLLYLLGYAEEDWLHDGGLVDAATRTDLLPAVARAYTRAAQRALRQGVLLGYRETEASQPVLRGRLRAATQMSRRPGLALPLEVAYDEHTVDIAENQLLLGAARRLLRVPGVDGVQRAALHALAARLDGVTPPVPGAPPPRWRRDRLNVRYHRPLALAELILGGASYELEDGRAVTVDGVMFRMWQVYEAFLARALGEALTRKAGGTYKAQDRGHFLATPRKYVLKPDLVHYLPVPSGGRRAALVVDAKYKRGFHRDDLYQMLAYCVRLGLTDGHLVYASGRADVVRVSVADGEVALHRHVLDLSKPQRELEQSIEDLAGAVLSRT